MRRITPGVEQVATRPRAEARSLGHDPRVLLACLERFVQPARRARLERVFGDRVSAVTVLMDAPYDFHNGGAIVRTLDAFGAPDLHVVERQVLFLASNHVARGAHKWVDVHTCGSVLVAVSGLSGQAFELVATHPDGDLAPEDLAAVPRLCLVLGNERDGISRELAEACARRVRVPRRGFVESLDVSVTAAMLLHRALEGRAGDLPEERRLWLRSGACWPRTRARKLPRGRGHRGAAVAARGGRAHGGQEP